MNIIVLGPDYKEYSSASYQFEFMKELKRKSEKYFHYSKRNEIEIDLLISKAKFVPDIVFYNHGWLSDNPNLKLYKWTKLKGKWPKKNIKHIIFLNKEYSILEEKLNEIKQYKFDLILTHLHDFKLLNTTNIKSLFLPLAFSNRNMSNIYKKKLKNRKFDLYFSGILQNWNFKNSQNDLRKKIQSEIFYCINDFPLLKKNKYKDLKIYWKPFYRSRIKNILSNYLHGERLSQKDYFNQISNSKCVLHTSSPIGIISTRIFESLGSGSIGLFSDDSNADVIFKENIHFLNFSTIDEFIKKIYLVKSSVNSNTYQEIADQGIDCVQKFHTWRNRVSILQEELKKL
tara:strand:+ start:284 stop:1312 length:1029 start_codon:yes stop_codon:yes gene_type:complete